MNLKKIGYASLVAVAAVMISLGSATTSEAKGKKKEAAAPAPTMPFCWGIQKPVCATKGDQKFTYANACYARRDGAKLVSEGACPDKKAAKGKKSKGKKAAAKPKGKKK